MIKQRSIVFIFILTLFCVNTAQAINAPTDLVIVPRYDGAISLVVNWTDSSPDESGFEVQRRPVGGTYVTVATPAAGIEQFVDITASANQSWEYQVRALNGATGHSAWVGPSVAMAPVQVWPLNDGSHNVLDNYGMPLESVTAGNFYFHRGVDISGSGVQVNAGRGGVVNSISNGAGGQINLTVDYGPTDSYSDPYAHVDVDDTLGVGEVIPPGARIGTVRNDFFNRATEADHVHWGSRDNLKPFTNPADLDPGSSAPVVADANNDGQDFIVVDAAANDHTKPRNPAWGSVDFLVDAYDDMSNGNTLEQGLFNIGYWIQASLQEAENVRSVANPYKLIEFSPTGYAPGGPAPTGAVESAVIYWQLEADLQGIDTWKSFLTWIVTNTKGSDGSGANVDATQFWRTDARKGTGTEANGSDAQHARENQEAKFPDEAYFVHVLPSDHVTTSDYVRRVDVDNSRPYVKRVTVFSGARIVYQAQWIWDSVSAQLSIQPATFDAAAPFTALRTQDVTIEVEFSEPMKTASVTSVMPLGKLPTLSSEQPEHARTVWKGIISNLDIADDGSNDGTHMITIDGTDLAGNKLLQINNRNTMPADHHNRDASGNLKGTIGTDTIHGFKIGPLKGVIPVTAIFMKQTATDPASPSTGDKALQIQTAIISYFNEVSYGNLSFSVTPFGWYQLQHPVDWYYTKPQTPLVDLVQEAVQAAENNGNTIASGSYVLVVTDETASRDEWSIGGWPYTLASVPGQLLSSGVLNLASSDAHVSNLAGRMVGLIDLFAYPEVIAAPFVGPWSHMADKEHTVHVLGWEKWRAGWLDETGTATGNTLTRVAKPSVGSPIVDKTYTIKPIDTDDDSVKMIAITIGDRLHYTAEYRRQQNLDSVLPDSGVLITKTNDYINQGEGPAIIKDSSVTTDLSDATYNLTASRNTFNDVGSGVSIAINSLDANQAEIKLNYTIPPKENDVFVSPHDERWKAEDIWIDAPKLDGTYAGDADPLTVKDADKKPVIGMVNKVYGRIRNQGHADASNFEVRLEIREPWGAGGPWRSLKVDTVPLLKGQDHLSDDYYLVKGEWTPTGDVHSCVKLEAVGIANDDNKDNNWTQENISEFVTTPGSPFAPVTSRFEVENPFGETIPVFFKVEGLPSGWSYLLTPQRLVIPAKGVGSAQVTIQPTNAAPLCSKELITISAHTPRVDTLKSLGAITLQTALKNPANITAKSWTQCGKRSKESMVMTEMAKRESLVGEQCAIATQGCTNPKQPNTQVAIVYTAPDGTTQVRYVTTDGNGCYQDYVQGGEPGLWQTQVVLEETDCRAEAKTPKQSIVVPSQGPFAGPWWCLMMWGMFVLSVIAAIVFFAMWWCTRAQTLYRCFVAALAAMFIGWLLLIECHLDVCWFLLSIVLAVVCAAFWIYAVCFRNKRLSSEL